MNTALILLAALLLDLLLGDPRRWHPLAGFGHLAQGIESLLHGDQRWRGVLALLLVIAPWVAIAALMPSQGALWLAVQAMVLYFTLGATSLARHGQAVAQALEAGDLVQARLKVSWIVSRDTAQLDETGVARAACESMLENGNDA